MSNDDKINQQTSNDKVNSINSEVQYISLNISGIDEKTEEINIFELLKDLWHSRLIIFKMFTLFLVIGLLVALLSKEEYTTSVKLLPETQPELSLGRLGSLATQFGLTGPSQSSGDIFAANLYPDIIRSNAFISILLDHEVNISNNSQTIPLKHYVSDYQKKSFLSQIFIFPFILKDLFMKGPNANDNLNTILTDQNKADRLVSMSQDDWETLREIRKRISTTIDNVTGVVTITVKMQDPIIAADVADEIVQLLSEYIIQNRTEKARRDASFIEERFNESKYRFEQVQRELAEFHDANRGQLTAVARTEEQLLMSRYNLNFNLYNSMAERLEEARIKLQEDTPVINILEPPSIPDERSEPNRILILFLFSGFGIVTGIGIIFGRKVMNKASSKA